MTKEFRVDLDIYSSDIINQAITDFSEVGKISFSWNNISIYWENSEDIDEIFSELMNYMIWLINEK